jgi:hypothetical protein
MRLELVAKEISEAVQKDGAYIIRDAELRRIWPDLRQRYIQLKDFAAAHGWRVFAYGDGRGAMIIPKGRADRALRSKLDLEWWCGRSQSSSILPEDSEPRHAGERRAQPKVNLKEVSVGASS